MSESELGIALTAFAVGLFIGTRLAGWPISRLGSRSVVRGGMPLLSAAFVGPALATNLSSLSAAFFVFGAASGLLDVALNVQAVAVERRYRRPIMSSFHGGWSAGMLVGAGAATIASGIAAGVVVHFIVVAFVVGTVSLATLSGLLGADEEKDTSLVTPIGAPGQVLRSPAVALLGVVAFSSYLGEGAANDWSAVYVRDTVGTSTGVAGLAFVGFALGMTATRFFSDRLSSSLGPVRVVRAGGLLAAAGLALGIIEPTPGAAIVAFVLLGAALAPVVPIAFSAAGNLPIERRASALGWVVTIGYLGSILGPALIGFIADVTSLRIALVLPASLGLVIAALARAVASAPGAPYESRSSQRAAERRR